MLKLLKTIILSRLTKPKEELEVLIKRRICKGCEYNSLNAEKIELKKRVLIWFSDFYSTITGNKEEDSLGNCLACSSCSIYYKSLYEDHCPHPIENKWKII